MPGRYQAPSYREGTDILQLPAVRKALHAKAQPIAARAKSLARGEGLDEFAGSITVEDGTRPKGRPYSYVIADHSSGDTFEFGDSNTARRRILGRAGL